METALRPTKLAEITPHRAAQRSSRVRAFGLAEGLQILSRRLNALTPLSPQDEAFLRGLGGPLEIQPAARELSPPQEPRFLVAGWACRFRLLSDGRRQIIGFLLPGDALGLSETARPLESCRVTTLTHCRALSAGPVPNAIREKQHTQLARALRLANALDESFLLDHIVRLGRQTANERLCHLLLELRWRLAQAGLTQGWHFPLPLTQEMLADATGLSIVHVNRTLQQMRREKLIELRHGMVHLLQPDLLAEIADFHAPDPGQWAA